MPKLIPDGEDVFIPIPSTDVEIVYGPNIGVMGVLCGFFARAKKSEATGRFLIYIQDVPYACDSESFACRSKNDARRVARHVATLNIRLRVKLP